MWNKEKLLEIIKNYKNNNKKRIQKISMINKKMNEVIEDIDIKKDNKDLEQIIKTIEHM